MPGLRDIIDEVLDHRMPEAPPELRDRIAAVATGAARQAAREAVIEVLSGIDYESVYAEVDRYRRDCDKQRSARKALREAARALAEIDDDDDIDAPSLADRIARLGPKAAPPAPIQLAPSEQPA